MFGNKIRLSTYPGGRGTKTEIDGVELKEVADISLECTVDDLPRLTVEVIVNQEQLDVTLENASVVPHFRVINELELVVEQISPTQTRYRTVRRGEFL